MAWYEKITGSLEQKRQFRADRRRMESLPAPYVDAATAMFRYLMHYGGLTDGDVMITMVTDLVDLWERAAADQTPVRDIVGADPVDFVETFAAAYTGRRWIDKERTRLVNALDRAAGDAT